MITSMNKKTIFLFLFTVTWFLYLPIYVNAADFSIRPFLIEKEVVANDVVTDQVFLTNDSDYRKYVVFVTVNEISVDNSGEIKEFITPVMTDRTITPTSWVEITRGRIEIEPKGKEEVPLTVRVNPKAQPGEYFVFLGFVPAPNRPAAESIAMAGEADGVILKITVADKRKESIKIDNFSAKRFVINEADKVIDIRLSNLGDLAATPVGEIIFYNSRGEEMNSVEVNQEGLSIEPGQSLDLKSAIPLSNKLGRYKANLSLQYGTNQAGSLYDTTFFYMMPLHLLLVVFGGILVVVILLTLLLRRAFIHERYYPDDGEEVTMYVRDGHDANPKDHDIDLKTKKE